jgi:hypothetical protein
MKLYVIIVISIFIIISCNDNESNVVDKNVLMPLKLGNSWTYKFTYFKNGKAYSTTVYTETVICDSTVNSLNGFLTLDSSLSVKNNNYNWYSNQSDGLHYWRRYTDTSFFLYSYKFPCKKGDIFNGEFGVNTVESINYEYKTETGTFICHKYVTRANENGVNTFYVYYCPGIGYIANEFYHDTTLMTRRELLSYKLN